jgi:tetratricopeptide (TPR) repeat protein
MRYNRIMRLPPRIVVPVVCAVLVMGVFLTVLFQDLESARAFLTSQLMGSGTGKTASTNADIIMLPDGGDEALLHLRRGDIAALRGDWKTAGEEYLLSVDAHGGLVALRKLASAQLQRRDIRGARETLDRMRREGSHPEDLLLLESVILLRTGEMEKARDILNASDDSPHKHYGLALLAIAAGDHAAGKAELDAVVGGWEPVLRSYAKTLAAAYEEYALFPESPETHLQTLLARALADVQECELALPMLAHVTQVQSDYRDAWIVQGFCELSTERTQEAVSSLEQAYQLDPEKPETQYFLARAYGMSGNHEQAVTYLQYALRNGFKPESEVRRLLAKEALEIGNTALAMEQFEMMTQQNDADVDMFGSYIAAAITVGQKEEAYAKAQEAVKRWPDDASAHELLGWAAAETGRTEEARKELQEALRLDPTRTTAQQRLQSL